MFNCLTFSVPKLILISLILSICKADFFNGGFFNGFGSESLSGGSHRRGTFDTDDRDFESAVESVGNLNHNSDSSNVFRFQTFAKGPRRPYKNPLGYGSKRGNGHADGPHGTRGNFGNGHVDGPYGEAPKEHYIEYIKKSEKEKLSTPKPPKLKKTKRPTTTENWIKEDTTLTPDRAFQGLSDHYDE